MSIHESEPLIDPDDSSSKPDNPEPEVDPDSPLDPPEDTEQVDPDRPLDPPGGPDVPETGYAESGDQKS
jgi:hypothetical protein